MVSNSFHVRSRSVSASDSGGDASSTSSPQERSRPLSTHTLGLIWFGAAVSLAEILTGTFFAPLGFAQGMAAILVGHIIGGALFWLVAFVSAKTGASAMQAVARSFGGGGAAAFSLANVVQLIGWTAIMIASGAAAATQLVPQLGAAGWCVAISVLIVAWIAMGVKRMGRVQSVAAVLLLGLTFVVSFVVFGASEPGGAVAAASAVGDATTADAEAAGGELLSFGAAVELAAAMPLSWLPVAGDYLREAKRPAAGAAASALAYTVGSCWMFAIGLGCALFAGSDDIATILMQAGFGVVGVLVVVFSTVTTTFLDAQSAGVSALSVSSRLDARTCGIAAAIVGCVLAVFAPVSGFEDFLYFIGSVFAPMATLVCVDYFALHRDRSAARVDWRNIALWAGGFALYRFSLAWDVPCGNTLPVMAAVAIAAIFVDLIVRRKK